MIQAVAEKVHLAVVDIICSEKRTILLERRRDLWGTDNYFPSNTLS